MADLSSTSAEVKAIYLETDPVKVESMISRIFGSKLDLTDAERAELRKAYQHRDALVKARKASASK